MQGPDSPADFLLHIFSLDDHDDAESDDYLMMNKLREA